MTDDRHKFSDRLIQCEAPTPVLYGKYRKEITMMLEKELSPLGRVAWIFWAVFGLAQAILFGYIAVISYGDLPLYGTVGFGAGVVFGLAFGSLAGWTAWTGRINLRTQGPAMAKLVGGLAILMAILALAFPTDSDVRIRMIVSLLPFLVIAAVIILTSHTEQAELRTKEKLLEIEYRIAELGEHLQQRDST
ncbi:MAG: hypothetical protein H8E44_47440 [Planctomycetes bacterium]|nr:hypothetical protein [Planctomycetota bacterium]